MTDTLLFAITMGVTVLGLLASWAALRRRGAGAGLRGAAWSLVPLAAYLTGLTEWATALVFSPVKWAGVTLFAVAALLYVISGLMLRRRGAAETAPGAVAASRASGGERAAVERPRPGSAPAPDADPDLAEIEEILRRRGIG